MENDDTQPLPINTAIADVLAQLQARRADPDPFDAFLSGVVRLTGSSSWLNPAWERSVAIWLQRGLTLTDLFAMVAVAANAEVRDDERFRYFAGCCWRTLENRAKR